MALDIRNGAANLLQSKGAAALLLKYGMEECSPVKSPADATVDLSVRLGEELIASSLHTGESSGVSCTSLRIYAQKWQSQLLCFLSTLEHP